MPESLKRREQKKAWMRNNAERHRELCRAWNKANPDKLKAAQRAWAKRNPDKVRAKKRAWNFTIPGRRLRFRQLLSKHGITVEDWARAFNDQDGKCAGCCSEFVDGQQICIDHDHKTGAFRGLLCTACNFAIGLLLDSPRILVRLASYLLKAMALKEAMYEQQKETIR